MCFTYMTPTCLLEYISSVFLFLCELFLFTCIKIMLFLDEEFSPCVQQLLPSNDTHLRKKTVLELKGSSSFVFNSVTKFKWSCP